VFEAPVNTESVYITALILALIISPARSIADVIFLEWAAIWAMASKYIVAVGKKHLFNPAAIAVVLTAFVIGGSASWWIGTGVMAPFVIIGGLLIVRKMRRGDLVYSFFMTALITIFIFTALKGGDIFQMLSTMIFNSSLCFFVFIMLTEPLTTPPTKQLQILYGILVGFLFAPQIHVGPVYSTPELALVVGNIFSFLVSPKQKLLLHLQEKIQIAPDIVDFVFVPEKDPDFTPGQYMEWTIPHDAPDGRGNRRYWTIASSPTEKNIRLGVKFYADGSSYKKAMIVLDGKKTIVGGQLAGDFTLPKNKEKKLVFIAGGIGITPFRSMLKYLIDMQEKRSIIVLYANRYARDIVYKDILDQAKEALDIQTIYTITDKTAVPSGWQGKVGRIDDMMIQSEIPDYQERTFYLSGPHGMVTGFEDVLRNMGIARDKIVTDFFPGFV